MKPVNKITICGFGLIGGCMALDFLKGSSRRKNFQVIAYDRPKVLDKLRKSESYKVKVEANLKKAVSGADIIILAATHKANETLLRKISKIKELENCLILDTGAVKSPISKLAKSLKFTNGNQFLPTHPMAGKEKSGFENSDANLFKGHAWYIDKDMKLSAHNLDKMKWMTKKLKVMPVLLTSNIHDEIVSEISHLPQLLSTILGSQMNQDLIELAGPGLKSMLRLSGSPYSVWSEIIEQNKPEIIKALNVYKDNIDLVTKMIKDNKSLSDIFKAAARSYKCL